MRFWVELIRSPSVLVRREINGSFYMFSFANKDLRLSWVRSDGRWSRNCDAGSIVTSMNKTRVLGCSP